MMIQLACVAVQVTMNQAASRECSHVGPGRCDGGEGIIVRGHAFSVPAKMANRKRERDGGKREQCLLRS